MSTLILNGLAPLPMNLEVEQFSMPILLMVHVSIPRHLGDDSSQNIQDHSHNRPYNFLLVQPAPRLRG
jgi:hypothetical protein